MWTFHIWTHNLPQLLNSTLIAKLALHPLVLTSEMAPPFTQDVMPKLGGHLWQWFLLYTPELICPQILWILGPKFFFPLFISLAPDIVQVIFMALLECHNIPLTALSSSVSTILSALTILFTKVNMFNKNKYNYIAIMLTYRWLPFSLRVETEPSPWAFLMWSGSGSPYSPGVTLSFTFPTSIILIIFVFLEMLCFFQLETFVHTLLYGHSPLCLMGHGMQYLHGVRNDNPLEYSYH